MALSKVVPGQKITASLFNEVIDGINDGGNSAGNGNTSILKNSTSFIQYPPDWVNNYGEDLLHSWTPENEWFKLGPLVMKEPIAIVNNIIQTCELDSDCNNSSHDVSGQWYAGVRKDKLGIVLKQDIISANPQLYIYTNQLTTDKEKAYVVQKIFNIFINDTPTDPCLYTFQNIPPTFYNIDSKYKSYFDLEYKDVSESDSTVEKLYVVRNHPYYDDVEQTLSDFMVPEKDCTVWLNLSYKRDPITNDIDKSEAPEFFLSTAAPITPYLGYKLWDIEDWAPVTDYRTSLVPLYSTPKVPKVYDSYFQYSVEVDDNNVITRKMKNNTFWYNNVLQHLPDYTPPSGTGTIWLHMKKSGNPVTTTFSIDMVAPPPNSKTDYGISLWVLNNWEVELDGRTSIVTFNDSFGSESGRQSAYPALFDYEEATESETYLDESGNEQERISTGHYVVRNVFYYNDQEETLPDYKVLNKDSTVYLHVQYPLDAESKPDKSHKPTFFISENGATTGDYAYRLWELDNWDVKCDCRTALVPLYNQWDESESESGGGGSDIYNELQHGPFRPVLDNQKRLTGLIDCWYQWERHFIPMGIQAFSNNWSYAQNYIILELTHPTGNTVVAPTPSSERVIIEGNTDKFLHNTDMTKTYIPLFMVNNSGIIQIDFRAIPTAPVYR